MITVFHKISCINRIICIIRTMGGREGGGGCKGLPGWFGALFSTLSRRLRACQDGLGHFFSTFARLTERVGGLSKAVWAVPI